LNQEEAIAAIANGCRILSPEEAIAEGQLDDNLRILIGRTLCRYAQEMVLLGLTSIDSLKELKDSEIKERLNMTDDDAALLRRKLCRFRSGRVKVK
jgi:hypothetical protein